MVATLTVISRAVEHALSDLSEDTYLRKLAVWANKYDCVAAAQRPPKPPAPPPCCWRQADDAMTARLTAYTTALALWRAKHARWRAANSKRKAKCRAERDARRDWAAAWQARKNPRLEAHESSVRPEPEHQSNTASSRLAGLRALAKHPHPLQPISHTWDFRLPWKEQRRCSICAHGCVGIRYHCATCGDFDACQDCVARGVALGTMSMKLSCPESPCGLAHS